MRRYMSEHLSIAASLDSSHFHYADYGFVDSPNTRTTHLSTGLTTRHMSPSMAVHSTNGHTDRPSSVPYTDLAFDVQESEASALKLVYWIRPKWRDCSQELDITKFTDGITNTLLKISRHKPGAPPSEADDDAILMRAYGNGTDVIIDRDREAASHGLLAERGMAPPLLGRFRNGLLYGFIPGIVCKAQDLAREPVWRGIAQKLAEWHAKVPIAGISSNNLPHKSVNGQTNGNTNGFHPVLQHNGVNGTNGVHSRSSEIISRRPVPNVWSVMQNWVNALPTDTEKAKARKEMLQQEVERSFQELDRPDGIGEHGFVFAHCDLLCANVIQLQSPDAPKDLSVQAVTFIDYEYATPAPAVFDISNHFAEWAGYDCDYSQVPTKSVRRGFLQEYVTSYNRNSEQQLEESTVDDLYQLVDMWRGIPGLYWGIWSLIQARISEIDFDYSNYAEERLGEYFAWRAEADGTRAQQGSRIPLREKRWAEE